MSRGGAAAVATGLLAAIALGVMFRGRAPSESPVGGAPDTATPPAAAAEDLDALRALGYVDEASEVPATAPVGVLKYDRRRARGGIDYVTVAPNCTSYIARPDGEVLRRWSHSPCRRWSNSVLTPGGDVVVAHTYPLPPSAGHEAAVDESASLLKLDWDGQLLWERKLPVHHDVALTPDGNIAVLTRRLKVFPHMHPTIPVRDHGIAILSPDGELLEEASLMEIVGRSSGTYEPIPGRIIGGANRRNLNLLHANSIDWMGGGALAERNRFYSKENVLVTLRAQNAVVLIHWPTRKIVWSWGQKETFGPHDGQVLPTGNILLFDNGTAERRSRILELNPVARKIAWEYRGHDFFSISRSGAQRLPSGNTLAAVSNSAEAFEVTPEGELVWEFRSPEKGPKGKPAVIVRIRNYDPGPDGKPRALVD